MCTTRTVCAGPAELRLRASSLRQLAARMACDNKWHRLRRVLARPCFIVSGKRLSMQCHACEAQCPCNRACASRVHDFKKADWTALKTKLNATDWAEFFDTASEDDAAERCTTLVLDAFNVCAPARWITEKLYPPLVKRRLRRSVGTETRCRWDARVSGYARRMRNVFRDTHKTYVGKMRNDLKKLAPYSRSWWKLSGNLFTKSYWPREHSSSNQKTTGQNLQAQSVPNSLKFSVKSPSCQTAQLSKVVARAVATLRLLSLQLRRAFGPNQHAYSKGRGHRDVLTATVCSWLRALERGVMAGLY